MTGGQSRASRCASLCRNVISSLCPLDQVQERRRAARIDPVGIAGGPADVASDLAVVPWLCVTAFRRFCSEQRLLQTASTMTYRLDSS